MYGVCALGISIDRVAQDRGMLGLRNLVNSQGTIEANGTNWSQWRYVVKLWFSESGTSGMTLALDPPLEVSTRTYQGPPSTECRAWFPYEKRWRIASVVFESMRQRSTNSLEKEFGASMPAQRPGRLQVLLVCVGVLNGSGGIHFGAMVQGM